VTQRDGPGWVALHCLLTINTWRVVLLLENLQTAVTETGGPYQVSEYKTFKIRPMEIWRGSVTSQSWQ